MPANAFNEFIVISFESFLDRYRTYIVLIFLSGQPLPSTPSSLPSSAALRAAHHARRMARCSGDPHHHEATVALVGWDEIFSLFKYSHPTF